MGVSDHKNYLRLFIRKNRKELQTQHAQCADSFTAHILDSVVGSQKTVAAFLPLAAEPPILSALTQLHHKGHSILVPVVLPHRQLAWVRWTPTTKYAKNSMGIMEPQGKRYDHQAFAQADYRLVPALAYDLSGRRLGQGGGYYDRIFGCHPQLAQDPHTFGVIFAREILDALPHDSLDAVLDQVITEEGLRSFAHSADHII